MVNTLQGFGQFPTVNSPYARCRHGLAARSGNTAFRWRLAADPPRKPTKAPTAGVAKGCLQAKRDRPAMPAGPMHSPCPHAAEARARVVAIEKNAPARHTTHRVGCPLPTGRPVCRRHHGRRSQTPPQPIRLKNREGERRRGRSGYARLRRPIAMPANPRPSSASDAGSGTLLGGTTAVLSTIKSMR